MHARPHDSMSSHPCREILGNGLDERTVLSCKFNRSAGTADDHYPMGASCNAARDSVGS